MSDYADQSAMAGAMHFKAALARARALDCAGMEIIYCQDCGEEIPEARRKAVPGCRLCVPCQQIRENQRR